MLVLLTEAAEEDLETIGDWIAKENPDRALSFVKELREACQTLRDLPLGCALVPRFEHTRVRRRVHGDYLIFYRVMGGVIEVLHILHGARDFEKSCSPTDRRCFHAHEGEAGKVALTNAG